MGGDQPTVTDANVVLGYINPDYFLGGRMKIKPELSRKAIEEKIAKPLHQSIEAAASGIHQVVNANMVGGILDMTVLVAGGGAGAIHAVKLAKELGMKKIVIPKTAPVLCAMGMLNADVVFSYVGSKYTDTKNFDVDGVNAMLSELEGKAKASLAREGIPVENQRLEYYVAARYPMEVSEIDMPLRVPRVNADTVADLEQDFHAAHQKRYAVSDPTSYIECTDWRVLGIGDMPEMVLKEQPHTGEDASKALKGKRDAYFEEVGGFTEAAVYDGEKLSSGMRIDGPAIIESPLTTTVVIPDCKVTINQLGSYVMELS